MVIDVHCHYTFSRRPATTAERFSFESPAAPAGDPPLPTAFDSCVSPRATARFNWRIARRVLHMPPPGAAADAWLEAGYARHLLAATTPSAAATLPRPLPGREGRLGPPQPLPEREGSSGAIDRFVLLAFDAVHDDDGRCPPLPQPRDRLGSDIYTSNSLVRAACRQHSDRFLFGASVHPYRRDAVACLDEVFAGGACLLKWIPLHHNIALDDPRTRAVLRRCAELGLPLLIHCGEEYTLTTQCPHLKSIRPLLAVLRELRRKEQMPTVIVAHAATAVTPWGDDGSHRLLLDALTGEFADSPLYADISALVTWPKAPHLRRLAQRQELHHKLLFGSDFPVPPSVWRVRRELGREYAPVCAIPSWPGRAAAACRALGFNEIVFHRAATLLPHVDYFAPAPQATPGRTLSCGPS